MNKDTKQPKDFQEATARRIVDIFKNNIQKRVLLSDEVGLGKTIVAKKVIAGVKEFDDIWDDNIYRVVYVCSNSNIAKQNTENLGIEQVMNVDESRLSMQHMYINKRTKEQQEKSVDGKPEVLIPLTPGTSFNIQGSAGNMNERALMYVIMRHLPEVSDVSKLHSALNIYGASDDNWNRYIRDYDRYVKECTPDYLEDIIMKVRKHANFANAIRVLNQALSTNSYKEKVDAIFMFRIIFCQISLEVLNPDLVILDEFQRFSSLLNTDAKNEESMIARCFFDKKNGPYILLVSATPYKPFTTLEELNVNNSDDQYKDFIRLMSFLFKERDDIRFSSVWKDYSNELCQFDGTNFTALVAKKEIAENAMCEAMCRTERYKSQIKEDKKLRISADDIRSYLQMQSVIEDCIETSNGRFKYRTVPIDYIKSSPYLLSFMDKYELKSAIRKVYEGGSKLPVNKREQRYLLKRNDINEFKKVRYSNARLERLASEMFQNDGDKLLWIPASHPYYKVPANSLYGKNCDFSKVLVFSAWEMVPRMISTMLSYEVEQRNISQVFPEARYTIKNDKGEDAEKNKRDGSKAGENRLREDSLKLLMWPSTFLSSCYEPQEMFNNGTSSVQDVINSVRTNIVSQANLKESSNPRRNVGETLELVQKLDSGETGIEVNDKDLDVLVNMAIGSPSICAYRLLNDIDKSQPIAKGIIALFNRRHNAAVLDVIYKNDPKIYHEAVLDYCVMGNLQAVLDEFAHMISEDGDVNKIAKRMESSIGSRGTLDVDTTSSFAKDNKKFSMRTHYAMPYTKIKSAEKETNRANDIQNAFNSPFRPFVLATTSVGQEGLDFHWYCRKIMHWNTPSNPQDIEQREGRITRFKGLVVRRNAAKIHPEVFSWSEIFELCKEEGRKLGYSEMVPFWSIPEDMMPNGQEQEVVERIVPLYPMSQDVERYNHLQQVLELYRLTMGQPRQEELLPILKDLTKEERGQLLFDLSPYNRSHKLR